MTTLGERIKAERERRGWTQAQLAAMLSVKIGTLSGYERDYRQPDLQMLRKIAAAFRVSTDYLLSHEVDKRGDSSEVGANDLLRGLSPEAQDELRRYARYLRVRETLESPDKESSATSVGMG